MEPEQYVTSLAAASDATAAAASAAGVDAAVPSCPGWTVTDLLVHMTTGDLWARTIIERRSTERVSQELPYDPPAGDELVPWFQEGARQLVAALAEIDPTTSVWTFSSADRTARFWLRRRAIESSVHRYDAQEAAGTPTPIDAALAVDAVEEFLTVFLPRFENDSIAEGKTIHLHCTDAEGEWLLTGAGEGAVVTREHAKGDAAVRGTASDLMLFLWGRVPASALEVFGDSALLDHFRNSSRV
jgi:uncharacterized protein (TIGR03083 family)